MDITELIMKLDKLVAVGVIKDEFLDAVEKVNCLNSISADQV